MTRPAVFADAEFRRIRDLPRRTHDWSPAELEEAADLLTEHFRRPGGTMRLKPIQARALVEAADHGKLVGEVAAGLGKAQPLSANVMTPTGPRPMGEISVGDEVLTPDGTRSRVLGVFPQGIKPVFKMSFSDGSSTRACDDHLWLTRTDYERGRGDPGEVRSTAQLRETLVHRGRTNHDIPVCWDAAFDKQPVSIPPYVMGALLGDGCFRYKSLTFYSADQEVVDRLVTELADGPYRITACKPRAGFAGLQYRIGNRVLRQNTIQSAVQSLGLFGKYSQEKHIPAQYLYTDRSARIALLQGLMDTDGYASREGTLIYYTTSPQLVADLKTLVWSLGGTCTVHNKQTFFTYKEKKKPGLPSYAVCLSLPDDVDPFHLQRKALRYVRRSKYKPTRYLLSVEPAGEEACQCILIDHPDHLYLTDDFVVTHNTLLSFLLFPTWEARRGLLLVPAHLREKTKDDYAILAQHWNLLPCYDLDVGCAGRPHFRILSYQSLSTVRFASFLDEFQPDVIVADESHYLSRLRSARGKRFFRYIREARKAGDRRIRFAPLSGTPRRKSLRECSHIYDAALGDGSPFPREYQTLEQWCYAIDEGVDDHVRLAPGALAVFAGKADPDLDETRSGVRDRLLVTPGIISTSESHVGVSLVFQERPIEVPQTVREAMRKIREEYALPNGETFDAGIAAWNHAREAATGFVYRWDPPAPEEWARARREWNTFVRTAMDAPQRGAGHLDSPLQVWNAVKAGRFGDPETIKEWTAWRDIRDTFEPNPVPMWLSDYLVRDAEQWALETGGIVWVSHTSAFTKAETTGLGGEGDAETDLGRAFTKIPYFGAGPSGEGIKTYRGPCVASYRAHGTGKNLVQWARALWMCFPSSGASVEQLAARHHRLGQMADEVKIEFYCHSREMLQAVNTAIADAKYMAALNGNEQRILNATMLGPNGHRLDLDAKAAGVDKNDPMWGTK